MDSDISALYPPPPPFYKFFTSENILKLNELRAKGVTDDQIRDIEDLKFLVSPIPPKGEQYRSFGELWWFEDKHVGLKESGVEQIYGDSTPGEENEDDAKLSNGTIKLDKNLNSSIAKQNQSLEKIEDEDTEADEEVFSQFRINELKKMTKSLLLNFLELVGLLAKNPLLSAKKIDHIRTILINIHHLLNSYRLHQSRESLILSMQEKLEETKEEITVINKTCAQVQSQLDYVSSKLQNVQELGRQKDLSYDNSPKKNATPMDQLVHEAIASILQDNRD